MLPQDRQEELAVPLRREFFLRAMVLVGSCAVFITEALSFFRGISALAVAAAWLVAAAVLVLRLRPFSRLGDRVLLRGWPPPLDCLVWAGIALAAGIVLVTALASPPNSADAMAYHLPRVIYWIQNHSVAFFPTPYLNQIMLPPVAEYLMMHTYLLTGGDHFVNLVQWCGFFGSVVAVSAVAAALNLNRRGQSLAALFCATLPNGILQASGAKTDCLMALWLTCAMYFALRWLKTQSRVTLVFFSLAVGLAVGTKSTAYLFVPPLLLMTMATQRPGAWIRLIAPAAAGVLLINGPQYVRNWDLSGSLLGFDSAQADGRYRWRNENLSWGPAVSNILRNGTEQLGARAASWNEGVYGLSLLLHRKLGLDPQDPVSTWPHAHYAPPRNANHEADANNRWHLLIFALACGYSILCRSRWVLFCLGPFLGFVAFCLYLKWQPFSSRLLLPLFVAASPAAGMLLEKIRPAVLQAVVCLLLLSNIRLALLENWTRPLRGPNSVLTSPRGAGYFNDMVQWNNRAYYFDAVQRTLASGCRVAGIDINQNQLEYPYQALLLQHSPEFRFVHTGVTNPSAKYEWPIPHQPCFQLCLDCRHRAD